MTGTVRSMPRRPRTYASPASIALVLPGGYTRRGAAFDPPEPDQEHGHAPAGVRAPGTRAIAAAALFFFIGAPLVAEDLVLSGVTVIDGTGRPPRSDQDVIVHDGRISEVRAHTA